jgi:hypothetical protein
VIKCASACDEIRGQPVCWYREVRKCAWFEVPCDKLVPGTVCIPSSVDLGLWMTLRDNDYGIVYPMPAPDESPTYSE